MPNIFKSRHYLSDETNISNILSTKQFTNPTDIPCNEPSIIFTIDSCFNLCQNPSIECNNSPSQYTCRVPILDPSNLVGRIFLIPSDEEYQRLREKNVKEINEHEDDTLKDSIWIKLFML